MTAPPAPARQRPDGQPTPQPVPAAEPHTRHRAPFYHRAFLRARAEVRLTALAIWRGIIGVYNSDDLTFASSIAYYALLSLFPFFLLLFSVIARVTSSETDRQEVLGFVLRYFPRQFDFVTTQLNAMQEARVQLGVAGSILMIWAAMGVFGAITSAVNHAWGVEKQPSYFKHKLISFVMLVAGEPAAAGGARCWSARSTSSRPAGSPRSSSGTRHCSRCRDSREVGQHVRVHLRRRADLLLRAERQGEVPRRLGGRGRDRPAWRGALAGFSWYVRDLTRFTASTDRLAPSSSS